MEFASGHVGMVQRVIGSSSHNTITKKSGVPRWRNKDGNVEKLQTMGSPSAAAMHHVIWEQVEPDVQETLERKLEASIQKTLAREAARKGKR